MQFEPAMPGAYQQEEGWGDLESIPTPSPESYATLFSSVHSRTAASPMGLGSVPTGWSPRDLPAILKGVAAPTTNSDGPKHANRNWMATVIKTTGLQHPLLVNSPLLLGRFLSVSSHDAQCYPQSYALDARARAVAPKRLSAKSKKLGKACQFTQ